MKVILARTAGFCMGVHKAVQLALETARSRERVFTCGPLIHNPQVVEDLRSKGIHPLQNWRTLTSGTIIIRAHGMPIQEIEEMRGRGFEVIDATCPHVLASQKRISTSYQEGRSIIIVGDRLHPEILSLQSFAPARHTVISSLAEAQQQAFPERCAVIAQTTFQEAEYRAIADYLSSVIVDCRVFQSICAATAARQNETRELAQTCAAIVVVGGRESANTRRLAEIAREFGKPTFPVEVPEELHSHDFKGISLVGLTAGASTPDWLTSAVKSKIECFDA